MTRIAGNIAANLGALTLLPFLMLAWIVRVHMIEFFARRMIIRSQRGQPSGPLPHSRLGWPAQGRLRR